MARSLRITCDQCGKQKREPLVESGNRWWKVAREADVDLGGGAFKVENCFLLATAEEEIRPPRRSYDMWDLCGEECVLKFVASKMREMQ
jgi:hypothetical protein